MSSFQFRPTVNLYHLDKYTMGIKEAQLEKDSSVPARLARMQSKYEQEGLRRTVEAVLLVHQHNHPHNTIIMSSIGQIFRVTTAGESHGRAISCIIDGCPPGLGLTEADIQPQLNRRRPGQSAITTPRNEKDPSPLTLALKMASLSEHRFY